MTRQRNKFTREQKLEAVRQIEDGEKTLSEVSRDFGVATSSVSAWRTQWRKQGADAFPGHGNHGSRDKDKEIAQLRRELVSVKEDNEILKKAAACFAKELP